MNKAKKRKILRSIILSVLILIILAFMGLKYIQITNYKMAINFMEEKEYGDAIELLEVISSYKDSKDLIQQCEILPDYDEAVALMEGIQLWLCSVIFLH